MDGMFETMVDFFNFEEQERTDRMITFNTDKEGFIFILDKVTRFDIV